MLRIYCASLGIESFNPVDRGYICVFAGLSASAGRTQFKYICGVVLGAVHILCIYIGLLRDIMDTINYRPALLHSIYSRLIPKDCVRLVKGRYMSTYFTL